MATSVHTPFKGMGKWPAPVFLVFFKGWEIATSILTILSLRDGEMATYMFTILPQGDGLIATSLLFLF